MIYHHTKNKGDLGVLKAKCDLHMKGYLVLVPETEHSPFDLVIWKDGTFKTVQVKYRNIRNGALSVQFSSSWADKHGIHSNPVDKSIVDVYCIYCPEHDKCYYLDPTKFNSTVTLRVNAPKNNQKTGILMVEDYCEVP